jgi:hypothetical protein
MRVGRIGEAATGSTRHVSLGLERPAKTSERDERKELSKVTIQTYVLSEDRMRSAHYASFAVAALAGASCFLRIGAAQAKTAHSAHDHDGVYALHIVTHHGSCLKTYNTKVAIRGAQVHATGHALIRGSGHIAGDRVLVTLRLLHHAVHVTGRMRDHSGSGKWSLQGLGCRGSWHATRQSQI